MSLALPRALMFVGVDWAVDEHAVCVMDPSGEVVTGFVIGHAADAIARLVRRPAKFGPAGQLPIAIGRPNGRLVDLLLEAGHPVVPVKPNAIKVWRESEGPSGAKNDLRNAEVVADYLRARQRRLRVAAPYSDHTKAVRTVVRTRGDLVEARVAATNQVSALLAAYWPGALALFADVESRISLEFLTRYPTPTSAARPAIKDLDRSTAAHLGEHPDGEVFTSLPRSGQINAAQMLTE
ncbi:IS110 family transposase [Nonomuraea mangrovi]|uniref:IS110 family transposase n=1 Tax=Nonomuraea mangrovi TaxID=2316207 RepID=A0ABW4T1C8_9ACTN